MEIFPSECGYFQYSYALNCGKDYWKYWLVYDEMIVDAYSYKHFDADNFLEIIEIPKEYIEVNRGINYRR